jgi:hypothetical protein
MPNLGFTPIQTQTFGAAPLTAVAMSASPATITYTVLSGPATISGTTVTLTGTGLVTLQASQPASSNYLAAVATTSFSVSPSSVVLAGDFVVPTNIAVTVYQGVNKTVAVPVAGVNGFSGVVNFTCSVPTAMNFGVCNTTTATLTSSSTGTANFTIATKGPQETLTSENKPLSPGTRGLIWMGILLPCSLPLFGRNRKNLRKAMLGVLVLLGLGAVSMTTTGCGAVIVDTLTPAGTYVLHANASSGSNAHNMTLTVTVMAPPTPTGN